MNNKSSLRSHLIRGASGSLALKNAHTAIGLVLAVILARTLGLENFGIYAFCLSIVQILTIPSMLGGQQLLVREVSAYQTKGEYHFLRGLLLRFRQLSFLVSVVLALAAAGIVYIVYQDSAMLIPFMVAVVLIPFLTVMQLQGAALRGLRHVLLGQAAQTLRPALVIVIIGTVFWISGKQLGAESALAAQVASSAVLVAFTFILLQRRLPIEAKDSKPGFETSKWAKSALPFVFVGGMTILNNQTSVVLLGILKTPEDVGLFQVAHRGASLIPFGLMAVNSAIAPTVAQMFATGEKERLQRMISKSILAVLAFALPVALGLILGGKWIISFVFGQEYASAYLPLVILCMGQLVNAGMGSVGLILNMAGLERFTARGVAVAAIASVLLNFALIPFFGVTGAAFATSISLIIWNILLFVWLYKKTGIVSTIIPVYRRL